MRFIRYGFLLWCVIFTFFACSKQSLHTITAKSEIVPVTISLDEKIATFMKTLSDVEMVRQLFLISVDGTTASASATIESIPPAGFIFFSRNFTGTSEHIIRLLGTIQQYYKDSKLPPFCAIDHEGGEVNRLRGIASPFPSHQSVAKFLTIDQAGELYDNAGAQLSALGFQVNFAPVVETVGDFNQQFIGRRSFGNIEAVGRYAPLFAECFSRQGIYCVLKHFPGNSNADPHSLLPKLTGTQDFITITYLKPFDIFFKTYGQNGIGVLAGHALVPAFDDKNPACLSSILIQDVLQEQLGFNGLIFSDDLLMSALQNEGKSHSEIAKKALLAGVDVLMLSSVVYNSFVDYFLTIMASDEVFAKRVRSAVQKIIRAKIMMNLVLEYETTLQRQSISELYNFSAQSERFTTVFAKGDALYHEYWR